MLPSSTQRALNEKRLKHFCKTRSRRDVETFVTILSLLPGDWDDTTKVDLYPPENESDSKHTGRVLGWLLKHMVGGCPNSFPSNKWQEALAGPQWAGRMTAHALWPDSFCEFCIMMLDKKASEVGGNPGPAAPLPLANGGVGDVRTCRRPRPRRGARCCGAAGCRPSAGCRRFTGS